MSEQSVNRRSNGTIEILRFFFAATVICSHLCMISDFTALPGGGFGVEFFFLISGLFMAQSAQKVLAKKDIVVSKETESFLVKKIKAFMPELIIAIIISFFLVFIPMLEVIDVQSIMVEIITIIPGALLTSMAGLDNYSVSVPGVSWYLSAMVIGLAIIYPLYLRWNSYSRVILFPLIGLFCIGYSQFTYGNLYTVWEINNLVRAGLVRAVGEMCLGAVIFDIAQRLNTREVTVFGRVLFTLIAVLCFISLLYFMQGEIVPSHSAMFIVMCIFVSIIYSEASFKIKTNAMISFLGKSSLCVYLFHMVIINIIIVWASAEYVYDNGVVVFIVALLTSMIIYIPIQYIREKIVFSKIIFKKID